MLLEQAELPNETYGSYTTLRETKKDQFFFQLRSRILN